MHFISKEKKLSPSAFIPLCEFGGNMSSVGIFIDHMNVFLCNSFQAKVLNDQLCYEVDLNRISNKDNIENELTRSTRPIDAKLRKKLCLGIMFHIEISQYQNQTPL